MIDDVTLPADWADRVRAAVADRPGLAGGTLTLLGAGLDSVAIRLDTPGGDAHVLRFPQHEEGAAGIAREARLLPELAPRLPVPVPRFAFTAPNPLGPGAFCCYPMVRGESLQPEEWHARGLLDEPETPRRIAAILDAVHMFPVEHARELGVQEWDLRASYTEDLVAVRAELPRRLTARETAALIAAWEDHLADDANFVHLPTLIHADFSLDHLPVTGTRISGLIDFGDTAIGDPDYDLAYLWDEAGPGLVRAVQACRGLPLTARQEAKLRFWALSELANDVLHAIEEDLPALRDRSLAELREHLSGEPAAPR
ncbi:phosphotransferase family protein [Actinomadura macrotermitis]|uniref:Aminoglycoside phosphotransferase domain-containing protein n=1 Tax=Actinomadura macrotermitis TaxID=2585200 RepID=A0A7K0BWR6_9ACTN|nr:phosphotransferase [Actinomadura macrotermitis]MQY05332.1 hypothetical protein [Actinomadura macrotermitis]